MASYFGIAIYGVSFYGGGYLVISPNEQDSLSRNVTKIRMGKNDIPNPQ